jgi:hypothetical protein
MEYGLSRGQGEAVSATVAVDTAFTDARLERLGVLRRSTVAVDWARLGFPVSAYLPIVAAVGTEIGEILAQLTALPEGDSMIIGRFRQAAGRRRQGQFHRPN